MTEREIFPDPPKGVPKWTWDGISAPKYWAPEGFVLWEQPHPDYPDKKDFATIGVLYPEIPEQIWRPELDQNISEIQSLEEKQDLVVERPTHSILFGGGGQTAKKYGRYFAEAGMPPVAIIDIKKRETVESTKIFPDAEYFQVDAGVRTADVERIVDRFPNAALVIITPQNTHADILMRFGKLIAKKKIPTIVEKPLAVNYEEASLLIRLIRLYPELARLVVSGSYTLDKAAPELLTLGVFDRSYPGLASIKPADDHTPDFHLVYPTLKEQLGALKNVRSLFIEGREDTREMVGKYGRTHLAIYPGGGITADLLGHLTEKLFRMGILDLDSEILKSQMFYTPIGPSKTPDAWQRLQVEVERQSGRNRDLKGVAETGGAITMFGKNGDPILLEYGKRGPVVVGDVRRSIITFEHGTLTTKYITNTEGMSNIFTIQLGQGRDATFYSYYLDADPYRLMLERFKALWTGRMRRGGEITAQLLNAFLMDDVLYNSYNYFSLSPKHWTLLRSNPSLGNQLHPYDDVLYAAQLADLETIYHMEPILTEES